METKESINTFRPDWKDPKKYPDPKIISSEQWAWEFLRRSKAYQSDYLAYLGGELLSTFKIKVNPSGVTCISVDDYKGIWVNHIEYFSRKYGFGHLVAANIVSDKDVYVDSLVLPSPSDTQPPHKFGFISKLKYKTGEGEFKEYLARNELAYTFDFTRSIKDQFDMARALVENYKKDYFKNITTLAEPRKQIDSYAGYLRCLDANHSGIEEAAIAVILFRDMDNGVEKFEERLERAKALSNGDYKRQILKLSHLDGNKTSHLISPYLFQK